MRHLIATAIALLLPLGASAQSLSDVVDDYVTQFDISALDAGEQAQIVAVHEREDMAHGMKVLYVHEILLKANALQHVNMHSAEPQPFQLSKAD